MLCDVVSYVNATVPENENERGWIYARKVSIGIEFELVTLSSKI